MAAAAHTPAALADASPAMLMELLTNLAAATEDLVRGPRDGANSADRLLRVQQQLDAVHGLSQFRDPSTVRALDFGHSACTHLAVISVEHGESGEAVAAEWRTKAAYLRAAMEKMGTQPSLQPALQPEPAA
jgi:hypothetical protein